MASAGSVTAARSLFSILATIVLFTGSTAAANVEPAPLVALPAKSWAGNDGQWSTWHVSVGQPPQKLRMYAAIGSQNTWAVLPSGCSGQYQPFNCQDLRGGFYTYNNSRSWNASAQTWGGKGYYTLLNEIGMKLDIQPSGEFGFDTINLDWAHGSGLPVDHTIVAGMEDTSYYVGQIGLSPRPTNFTGPAGNNLTVLSDPQPSYLALMKEQNLVPSLSYGLQVGSFFRQRISDGDLAYGSLVFGGYDTSRMVGTGVPYPMTANDGDEFRVAVQDIFNGPSSILKGKRGPAFFASLDTTQPDIWLPKAVCESLESAWGILYDADLNRYSLDESIHARLSNPVATLTITIGSTATSNDVFNITLPYSALAFNLSAPIAVPTVRYVPIRRAANDTQLVLGRAFMQEAYLVANYENKTFTITPAAFDSKAAEHIVSIKAVANEQSKPNKPSSLSTGAKIGIIVAAVLVALILVLCAALFFLRRVKKRRQAKAAAEDEEAKKEPYIYEPYAGRHEVEAEENQIFELPAETYEHEADPGHERVELAGKEILGEMYGSPVEEHPALRGRSAEGTGGAAAQRGLPVATIAVSGGAAAAATLRPPEAAQGRHRTNSSPLRPAVASGTSHVRRKSGVAPTIDTTNTSAPRSTASRTAHNTTAANSAAATSPAHVSPLDRHPATPATPASSTRDSAIVSPLSEAPAISQNNAGAGLGRRPTVISPIAETPSTGRSLWGSVIGGRGRRGRR